jgi:6-phosphogluconolactonase (cycloisomerase 2 family)
VITKPLSTLALAALVAAACEPNRGVTEPQASTQSQVGPQQENGSNAPLAVYTLTNQVAGNAVAAFARGADGMLTPDGTFPTGGAGTGASLGSQGAVTLSADGRLLFAVNAGSNDVSVFRVEPQGLSLLSRTPSGGTRPISVTISQHLVYVLNAGGAGNITGFTIDQAGALTSIAGSTKPLSGAAVDPAQVSFSADGRYLIVAEKATNLLDIYPVDKNGIAGDRTSFSSAGGTPFGFAIGSHDLVFVSEAAAPGSASSYRLTSDGSLQLVSGVVLTGQGAPCWAVVTRNGRFGFTGNGAGSISGFSVAPDGSIQLLAGDKATTIIGVGVNDIALSGNSRYLYALATGDQPAIHGFRIENDGGLTALGPVAGLPAGTRGLAAF